MDRYRYFIFNQRSVVVLGVLQVACAALCLVCGFIDAFFRKNTTLSETRAPVWAGLIMACPGALALFASQRKNPVLVNVMIAVSVCSCVSVVMVSGYACLTLTYGENDNEVFHHHTNLEVRFMLSRMVKGANATILLVCIVSLVLSSLIAFVGCRSLPLCGCYDGLTGLEILVPQNDPSPQTELVCTWQAGGEDSVLNSPVNFSDRCPEEEEEPSKLPPYSRLT
ncbi:uncharacterized protein ACWYII_045575 isoform 1-T2 [Salvelinus alpinus]|uniref:uncharacterized protein zgc:113425 isoform X1 n=1 Tax=Salvelinus sp. IW2-2015 TaxID=2691554 RepID=UPI000CDFEB3C|nr:uncharacterized protein LOC111965715 isoform X1 [Salvelinus alpinus]